MIKNLSRIFKDYGQKAKYIAGNVTMSSTGLPIQNVQVRQIHTNKIATTDYLGNYCIALNDEEVHALEVSYTFAMGRRVISTPLLGIGKSKGPYRLDFEF